jgi:hypothetical protein
VLKRRVNCNERILAQYKLESDKAFMDCLCSCVRFNQQYHVDMPKKYYLSQHRIRAGLKPKKIYNMKISD